MENGEEGRMKKEKLRNEYYPESCQKKVCAVLDKLIGKQIESIMDEQSNSMHIKKVELIKMYKKHGDRKVSNLEKTSTSLNHDF